MSLNAIFDASQDTDLRARVMVAVTKAGFAPAGGEAWVTQHMLEVCARPQIYEAYAYVKQTQPYHSRPGYDPVVVTDAMIEEAVAAVHDGQD